MEQPRGPCIEGSSSGHLGQPIWQPAEEKQVCLELEDNFDTFWGAALTLAKLKRKGCWKKRPPFPKGCPPPRFLTPTVLALSGSPNQMPSTHLATEPLVDPAQGVEKREQGCEEWEG